MNENKIVKWVVILSIVIVANVFFNYTLSLVFNSPEYDEYCSYEKTSMMINGKDACEQEGGVWEPAPRPGSTSLEDPTGFCNMYTKCQNEYEISNESYEQNVFISLIAIGILLIVASFVIKNPILPTALALTALLNFLIATVRYWAYSNELLRVLILAIALVALFYVAIKKFSK